ncbi:right-handed parallel beta-helix repeat-containing protein [Bacteroides sp.]
MRCRRLPICIVALFLTANFAFAGEIWVSVTGNDTHAGTREKPLRTLAQALKQAREWRRLSDSAVEGGIYIRLERGIYQQEETLFLRPEDSGTQSSPTVIEAVEPGKAVISGGVRVTGWKRVTDFPPGLPAVARGKVWVADAPEVGNRILESRQLWVNGQKAVRATWLAPGKMERMIDFDTEKEEIWIPTPAMKGLDEEPQLEMTVHQRWAIAILRVKEFDVQGERTRVTFHQPESRIEFQHPWPQPVIGGEKGNSSFTLGNAICLLDRPGEWYQEYPSGKIYYWPEEGVDLSVAEVTVPALETLLEVDGSLERTVSYLSFKGVSFEYAAWKRPSLQGHVTLQGGMYLRDAYKLAVPGLPEKAELENQAWIERPEAALRIRGAGQINFSGCTFKHLGATGLDYEWAVNNCRVEGCLFTDIGGTALALGAFPSGGFETHVPYIPVHKEEYCSDIRIANNLITEVTNEDWGGVGIGAGYVRHVTIEHNEVSHVNYSGICVGWGWTPLDSGMEGNRIHANYVHHFACQLYDAGGLYTLSNQPASEMTGNRIEHIGKAPYATNDRAFYIYFDEATDGYRVENNWCPEPLFDSNRPGPANVWINNGPEVSDSIKSAAGLQPEYDYLKER